MKSIGKVVSRLAILLFAVLALTISANADTTWVVSPIDGEHWTTANSPYACTSNVIVLSLTIDPGVEVIFLGNYEFVVNGILIAIGTEQDSIIFDKASIDSLPRWRGITFNETQPGSELKYCRISRSQRRGLTLLNSVQTIENCALVNNKFEGNGGGLYVSLSNGDTLTLLGCEITKDTSNNGGGIYADIGSGGFLRLRNCKISNNRVRPPVEHGDQKGGGIYINGDAELSECYVDSNYCWSYHEQAATISSGGGIFINQGDIFLANCRIRNNTVEGRAINSWYSYVYGGGLYLNSGTLLAKNSIFYDNETYSNGNGPQREWGGGIFINSGLAGFENCVIDSNTHYGLWRQGGTLSIINSIIFFNSGGQISGDTTAISATYSDVQGGYPGEGNINVNPGFLDNEFHLSSVSPCKDAGNPDTIYNDRCFPPSLGTVRNDMGAHGGPGSCNWIQTGIDDEPTASLPACYLLDQNYPNPFNPTTTIKYALAKPSTVKLEIFDILGRKVTTLVDETKSAGYYQVTWNASNQSSGMYFYRITAGNFAETKKLLLLK